MLTSSAPNLLLSVLSPSVRDSLLSRATPVELPFGTILYRPGVTPKYAYFPLTGLASIVIEMQGGGSAEVNMTGSEGVVGALHLLGSSPIPTLCSMQLAGAGLRIPYSHLQAEFAASAELRHHILGFVQHHSACVSQIAACNRLHSAEQRLVRWLLMAADKTGFDVLAFTHEYLAQLLATHRPTVSLAAGELQNRGFIQYSRGVIRILDRAGLESAACGCYGVIHELDAALYARETAAARQEQPYFASSSGSSGIS